MDKVGLMKKLFDNLHEIIEYDKMITDSFENSLEIIIDGHISKIVIKEIEQKDSTYIPMKFYG